MKADDRGEKAAHRVIALKVLDCNPDLTRKEAGFLGHVSIAETLTHKQMQYLKGLDRRTGM